MLSAVSFESVSALHQDMIPRYAWLCGHPAALPDWTVPLKGWAYVNGQEFGDIEQYVPVLNFLVAPLLVQAVKKCGDLESLCGQDTWLVWR